MQNEKFNKNVLSKTNDLRNRILFTILILSVYRLGTYIPLPGIDPQSLQELMSTLCFQELNKKKIMKKKEILFFLDWLLEWLQLQVLSFHFKFFYFFLLVYNYRFLSLNLV